MPTAPDNTAPGGNEATTGQRAVAITAWLHDAPDNTDHGAVRRHLRTGAALGLHLLLIDPGGKEPFTPPTRARRRAETKWENHTGGGSAAAGGAQRKGGVYLATDDPATLDRHLTAYSRKHGDGCAVNIAVAAGPSRLVVVDADTPAQVAAFLTASPDRPTPTVCTPGKVDPATGEWLHKDGGHWYFVVPDDVAMPTKVHALTLGGEHDDGFAVLFGARYVLTAPSTRTEGAYKPADEVAVLPGWLWDAITAHGQRRVQVAERVRQRVATGDLDPIERWGSETSWDTLLTDTGWMNTGKPYTGCGCDIWEAPGTHSTDRSAVAHEPGCPAFPTLDPPMHIFTDHDLHPFGHMVENHGPTLTRLRAYAAIHHGDDESEAMDALDLGPDLTVPDLDDFAPASSGVTGYGSDNYSPSPPGEAAAEIRDAAAEQVGAAKTAVKASIDRADALFDHSEVLRHIAAWADARGSSRVAVLAQVMMRATLAIPARVVLPASLGGDNVGLSMLNAVVGVTAGGKGRAEAIGRDAVVIRWCGTAHRFGPLRPATGEGLATIFAETGKDTLGRVITSIHTPAALLSYKDVETFGALVARSNNSLAGELLSMYMGDPLGFVTRDKARRVVLPAHTVQCGLSVGVQPTKGAALLSSEMLAGGLPHRFLWTTVRNGRRTDRGTPPAAITVDIPDYGLTPDPFTTESTFLTGEGVEDADLVRIDVAREVSEAIAAADLAKDDDVFGAAPEGQDQMFGHSALTRLKAACALAALHGDTGVTAEWWEVAGLVAAVSEATMSAVVVMSDAAAIDTEREAGERAGHRFAASDQVRADQAVRDVADKLYRRVGIEWATVPSAAVVTKTKRELVPDAWRWLIDTGRVEARAHKASSGTATQQFRRIAQAG